MGRHIYNFQNGPHKDHPITQGFQILVTGLKFAWCQTIQFSNVGFSYLHNFFNLLSHGSHIGS